MSKWVQNGMVFLGGSIVAFCLLELLVRLVVPAPPNFHVRDPFIGKRPRPSSEYRFKHAHGESHVRTNSLGWNAPEFSIEKPKGMRRIVHIGDSQVENMLVDTEQNFTTLLNEMLKNTESINLGVAGRGTYPELLTYRHYAREYDPDIVFLWFTSGNDLRDNYLVRNILEIQEEALAVPSDRLGWLKKLLIQHLRSPRFLYDRLHRFSVVPRLLVNMGLLSMEPEEFTEEIPLTYRTSIIDTPERAEAVEITRKLIESFRDEVDRGELVLALMPSLFESGYETEEDIRTLYGALNNTTLERDFVRTALGRIADDLDLPFLDLTPRLRRAYEHGQLPHIPRDGHISVEGNRMIAEEVVMWLRPRTSQ